MIRSRWVSPRRKLCSKCSSSTSATRVTRGAVLSVLIRSPCHSFTWRSLKSALFIWWTLPNFNFVHCYFALEAQVLSVNDLFDLFEFNNLLFCQVIEITWHWPFKMTRIWNWSSFDNFDISFKMKLNFTQKGLQYKRVHLRNAHFEKCETHFS